MIVIADHDPQSIFTVLNDNRLKIKMDSGSEAGMTSNSNWFPGRSPETTDPGIFS